MLLQHSLALSGLLQKPVCSVPPWHVPVENQQALDELILRTLARTEGFQQPDKNNKNNNIRRL